MIERVYTDGACSGNPGPGGWGAVIYFAEGAVHELGGFEPKTTNNRMELQGAIAALDFLAQHLPNLQQTSPITLYTDSEYVKNGITKWLKGWQKKGWKTSAGKPVLNMDLWKQLDQLNQTVQGILSLHWQYVKGHSGDIGNDRTDAIASGFAQGRPPALHELPLDMLESTIATTVTTATDSTDSQMPAAADSDPVADPKSSNAAEAMPSSESSESSASNSEAIPSPLQGLRSLLETLHMADDLAEQGYLLTSSEIADLVGISSTTVTGRGESWIWRNWKIQRIRQESHQTLWQLERIR